MIRLQQEQLAHDDMVRIMAQHFLDQNYNVYADISGFPSPPLVNGHRPDVAVYNVGRSSSLLKLKLRAPILPLTLITSSKPFLRSPEWNFMQQYQGYCLQKQGLR